MYKERTIPDITIYRPQTDGSKTAVQTIPITEDSKRVFKLMEEDYVELHFTLADSVPFEVGDFIIDEIFGRFLITEKQMPTYDTSTGGYDYSLKFEREYRKWKNWTLMLTAVITSSKKRVRKEANWSLTAALAMHAEEVINNLTVLRDTTTDGMEYSYTIENTATKADEVKNISYAATSILDALTAIADTYECEWWVTYEEDENYDIQGIIHFGKCEDSNGTETVFALVDNVESMTIQDDNSTYCNRLYAFGATTNVPSSYRKTLSFKVTEQTTVTFKDNVTNTSKRARVFRDADHPITKDMLAGSQTGYAGFLKVHGFGYFTTYSGGTTDTKVTLTTNFFKNNVSNITPNGGSVKFTGSFDIEMDIVDRGSKGENIDVPVVISVIVEDFENGKQVGSLYTASETFAAGFTKSTTATYTHSIDFEEIALTLEKKTYQIRVLVEFTMSTENYMVANSESKVTSRLTSDATKCIEVEDMGIVKKSTLTFNGEDYTIRWADVSNGDTTTYGFYFYNETLVNTGWWDGPSDFSVGSEYTLSFADLLINKIPMAWFASDYDNPSALAQIGENRLMLPIETGGYLQPDSGLTRDQIVELAVSFDNIFPRCVLTVTDVATEDKRQQEEYEDGSKTYWDWTQYILTAKNLNGDTFRFNKSFIKSGETLQIKFLTEAEEQEACKDLGVDYVAHDGYKLAGMTFDVNFRNLSQLYTIVRNDDYGAMFPNDTLKPEVGDPFILVGWDVRAMESLGLIEEAEKRLQSAAQEYLEAIKEDQFTFTCSMMSEEADYIRQALYTSADEPFNDKADKAVYVKADPWRRFSLLQEGAKVAVRHGALAEDSHGEREKHSRIIGYEFKLDMPYDSPKYTVGDTDAYSRLKQMEKEITKLGGQ